MACGTGNAQSLTFANVEHGGIGFSGVDGADRRLTYSAASARAGAASGN
jgi:hypothetical protein